MQPSKTEAFWRRHVESWRSSSLTQTAQYWGSIFKGPSLAALSLAYSAVYVVHPCAVITMASESFLARAERHLGKWLVAFAGVWLFAAVALTLYRASRSICSVGLADFFNKLKLSDAGDFVAGVIAVPAFIYLVRGFLTQQQELKASVDALNAQEAQMKAQAEALISQGRILERQLELAEAARLAATEPRFVLRRFVYARGREYSDAEIEVHADANWLLELRCEQHEVFDVELTIEPADQRVQIPEMPVRQLHLPVGGTLGRQLIPRQPSFPSELLFVVRYRRKDLTIGLQRLWMSADGHAHRLYS